jgi:hypothetical protein
MTAFGVACFQAAATLAVSAFEAEFSPSTLESRCRIFMTFPLQGLKAAIRHALEIASEGA